ncbi:hypothetical protein M8818_004313 [Zalaria obscura]|uniref:Uncharacterized protein n=1 Tax=Zalaria obscura TaxID=2024903 RepID=A0ACC3SCR8_9PEZI
MCCSYRNSLDASTIFDVTRHREVCGPNLQAMQSVSVSAWGRIPEGSGYRFTSDADLGLLDLQVIQPAVHPRRVQLQLQSSHPLEVSILRVQSRNAINPTKPWREYLPQDASHHHSRCILRAISLSLLQGSWC